MKKLLILVIAFLMVFSLAACGQTPATDAPGASAAPSAGDNASADDPGASPDKAAEFTGTFKIGAFSSLNDLDGNMITQAIDLYAKRTNAEGGLFGAEVIPIYYDNPDNSTENAVKIVQKFIDIDKIDVCIPSQLSSCILACGELLNKAKIPSYGLGLSPTWMAQGWEYLYRPTLNTDFSVPQIVKLAKKLNYTTVAVFEGQDDYGKTGGEAFRAACEVEGITVTTTENYQSGVDTDFSGQIAKILQTNPDTVYLSVLGGDVANVMRQFRQFGYKGAFLYGESLRSDVVDVSEGASDYTIICFPYVVYENIDDCTDEFTKEFLQMWVDEYGALPESTMAYKAWDACLTIDAAVKAAGSLDHEEIQKAMSTLKFRAIGGNFDFTTGSNECLFEYFGWVYLDGLKVLNVDEWIGTEDYNTFMAR